MQIYVFISSVYSRILKYFVIFTVIRFWKKFFSGWMNERKKQ